jgi:RNA-directed DNA polymerase
MPPMIERCKQALVKLALEPEWEAKFEANSYGFRPGRSCHDAKEALFTAINRKPKFVFDADIKGAVRRDSHHGIPEMIGRDEEEHL